MCAVGFSDWLRDWGGQWAECKSGMQQGRVLMLSWSKIPPTSPTRLQISEGQFTFTSSGHQAVRAPLRCTALIKSFPAPGAASNAAYSTTAIRAALLMLRQFPWQPLAAASSPTAWSRRTGVAVVTRSLWQPDTTAVGRVSVYVWVCRLDGETWYSLPSLPALKVIHVHIDQHFLFHLLQRLGLNAPLRLPLLQYQYVSSQFAVTPLQLANYWPSFLLIYSGLT